MNLKQHPLSAAFPAMHLEELSALTDDIATHGLRHPVVLFEGQVLDGWHRYTATLAAGLSPKLVELPDDEDPVAFVLSLNLSRRHLSSSQRAAAVVACREWKPSGRPEKEAPGAPFHTNEEMASEAGASVSTIKQAKRAAGAGLGEAVRDGKVSAKTGAAIAKLPPKERKKAIADPEGWKERLERKPDVPKGDQLRQEQAEESPAADEVTADLLADLEVAMRIIEADDKLSEAWDECKTLTRKYEQLDGLYKATCRELVEMTKEAKRWRRKAESLEKGRAA